MVDDAESQGITCDAKIEEMISTEVGGPLALINHDTYNIKPSEQAGLDLR